MGEISRWLGMGFPWGTLIINVSGSLLMGILVELGALLWQPNLTLRAFLTVGILGGYTTFSTFSLDVGLMIERNQWAAATGYALSSVILSVGGLFVGLWLVRTLSI
ncbi:putative fluoride ion transporter CrcB [Azospirillaceae bacterium]